MDKPKSRGVLRGGSSQHGPNAVPKTFIFQATTPIRSPVAADACSAKQATISLTIADCAQLVLLRQEGVTAFHWREHFAQFIPDLILLTVTFKTH